MCNTGINALRVTEEPALRGARPAGRGCPARARRPACRRRAAAAGRRSRPAGGTGPGSRRPGLVHRRPRPARQPARRARTRRRRARCRRRSARPRNRSGPRGSAWPGSVPRAQRLPSRQARTARCVRPSTAPSPPGPGQRPPAQDRDEVIEGAMGAVHAMAAAAGYLAWGASGLRASRLRNAQGSLEAAGEHLREALACSRAASRARHGQPHAAATPRASAAGRGERVPGPRRAAPEQAARRPRQHPGSRDSAAGKIARETAYLQNPRTAGTPRMAA